MQLRYYQEDAIKAIWQYFIDGGTGNPIAALPTGTGKSVIIAKFVEGVHMTYPGQRIMMLTHVKELIEQNFEKLVTIWPAAPAGIYSAGVGRKDTQAKIIFGGIQSVRSCPEKFGHIDLVIIDECHLVSPNANTSYQQFIAALKEENPYLKVIGLTATHYRLGLGLLTDGGLFTDICYDLTTRTAFNRLVAEGYLSPLIPKRTSATLNLDGVRIQGGEFVAKDVQGAVDKEEITYAALMEIIELGHDRKSWLIFATGIEHAEHIAAMLDTLGIAAGVVHSKLPSSERNRVIADFKAGRLRALVNNNVLTTGFDHPGIDLIGMLRPTNSPGLWVQMLGRGTRPVYAPCFNLATDQGRLDAIAAGPKQNCLVLDFAGNTKRLGPINDPVLPRKKGKKGGVAPVRECDKCGMYNHASVRVCECCGYEFPVNVKFGSIAGTDEIIADGLPVQEVFNIDRVVYHRHKKDGRPDAIKVTYFSGLRSFNTYVCLEHGGFAAKKARDWWRKHTKNPESTIPETTDQALELVDTWLYPARSIRVWINKKYPEIMAYSLDGVNFL